jgi:dephospho-CoA kinase
MDAMDLSDIYVIGLTGGIACGKSTVISELAKLGAWTLDADSLTYQLYKPGEPVYNEIVAAFGEEILTPADRTIDRAKLGQLVFGNPAELQRLESIVHPIVREKIFAWLADIKAKRAGHMRLAAENTVGAADDTNYSGQSEPVWVAVIDAIKLLEGGWQSHCDAVWVVTCTPEQQVERLVQSRGMRNEDARQRIAAQPPQSNRLTHADVVIDNSGSLEDTYRQIRDAWHRIFAVS